MGLRSILYILLLLTTRALALEPIVVTSPQQSVNLNPYLYQMHSLENDSREDRKTINPFFLSDFEKSNVFGFLVDNETKQTLNMIFSSGFPIDHLRLQRLLPEEAPKFAGLNIPREFRLATSAPAISLELPPGRSLFRLQIETNGSLFVADFKLQPKDVFWKEQRQSLVFFAVLAGGMLGLMLYSMLYYLSLRKVAFLYFSILACAYVLLEVVIAGYPSVYLDPPFAHYVASGWIVLNSICMIGLILFSNSYFSTHLRYPRYTKFSYYFIGFSLVLPALYPFAKSLIASVYVLAEIGMYFAIFGIAMRQMFARNRNAAIYVFGVLPGLVVLMIFVGRITHMVESGPIVNNLRFAVVTLSAVAFFVGNLILIDHVRASYQMLAGTLGENAAQQKFAHLIEDGRQFDDTPRTRMITVVFVDIVGFSKAISSLAQDQSFGFIRDFITDISLIIQQHGGIVDRSMGDGMISFFGYDLVDERPDHAADALRAAIAIQKHSLARFLSQESKVQEPRFPLRIGINTDNICVGNLGDGERFDVSLVGAGVFLARRFEAACEPHKILLGQSTYDSLTPRWRDQLQLIQRYVPVHEPQGLISAYECDPFRDRPHLLQAARDRFWRAEVSAMRHERFRLSEQVLIFATNHGPMELVNFSLGGFCLKAAANLSRGTRIEVDLAPLTRNELIQFMSPITVEVTWATPGDGAQTYLGVRFVDLNSKQRQLLSDTIRLSYHATSETEQNREDTGRGETTTTGMNDDAA